MRVPLSAYGSVDTEVHTLARVAHTRYIYICIHVTLNNGYTIRLLLYLYVPTTAAAAITTTTAKQQ